VDYGPYFALFLGQKGSMILGRTDYAIVRGLTQNFTKACCPAGTIFDNGDNGVGAMGQTGYANAGGGLTQGKRNLQSITDGTSNTIMVAEAAGRQQVYAHGTPFSPNAPCTNTYDANGKLICGWTLNAAWADKNTYIQVHGFSNDGLIRDGGCCVINCSNVNNIYGFHTGGVNVLRADGSTHFMSDTTAPGVLAAMITRNGGEVFNDTDQ
jgi:prepilin-type processing-associated H-X9-DG protein